MEAFGNPRCGGTILRMLRSRFLGVFCLIRRGCPVIVKDDHEACGEGRSAPAVYKDQDKTKLPTFETGRELRFDDTS